MYYILLLLSLKPLYSGLVWFCVSERFPVCELCHLSKSSSMPLCKACPGCGGMVHIRNVSCSCGHVFVAKYKQLLTPSGKHTLHSFIEP